jgi:hypothetical protein
LEEPFSYKMMLEIILGLVVLTQFGLLAWQEYNNRKERAKFINALIAKTSEQFRDLELTEKVEPIKPPMVEKEPEFIPESEIPQDKFEELIKREVA